MKRVARAFWAVVVVAACASDREPHGERVLLPHASVELPADASGSVRIEDPKTKMAVRFSLHDARQKIATREGDRAIYAGALEGDADLTLTLSPDGVEDSVRFPTKPKREATAYAIDVSEVAGLRLVANVLEFLDAAGAPRLRIGAPTVTDARGVERAASLSVRSCPADTDPRPPWGRPVVPPGGPSCDVEVSWEGLGVEYPAVVDPAWTTGGALSIVHGRHVAVTLPSKRVLIAGGGYGWGTEIYDPATGSWAASGPPSVQRTEGRAAVLDSGDVLFAGGYPAYWSQPDTPTTELFNETRGTWVPGPPMAKARRQMAWAKLLDGKVLAAGGTGLADAELYDPVANSWSPAGTMSTERVNSVATTLADGTVLVAGGTTTAGTTSSADIFSPPATWTPTQPMASGRAGAVATALKDHRVLVSGGRLEGTPLATAELYDPARRAWSPAGTFTIGRSGHSAVLLLDGRVLVAGGDADDALADTRIYDPQTNLWSPAGVLSFRRTGQTMTLLENGKALVAGPLFTPTEIYEPLASGIACSADGECTTGYCVDGICCDSRCGDPCEACTAQKKGGGVDGVCGPMPSGARDPDCPTLAVSTCGATGTCDGQGACTLQASGVTCGPTLCERDVLTAASCNGRGVCAQARTSCAPYACNDAASCGHGPCATNADCAEAFWCSPKGECLPLGCDGDHTFAGADRVGKDCSPYRCDPDGCKTRCRSTTECAGDAVCNSDHECIPIDLARRGGTRGWICDVSALGARTESPMTFTGVILFLLVFARRRAHARRTLSAVVMAMSLLALAAPVRAQDPKAEAREHFERGVKLSEEHAWDAALSEFLRSRELFPSRGAAKNVAVCLRQLGRYEEALDTVEGLLKDFPTMPSEDRWIIEREVNELKALIGFVVVRVSEAGATVVVDGKARGTSPLAEPVRVSSGTRVVQVYKEGFVPFELRVTVMGGRTHAVDASLKALAQSGRLVVSESAGKPAKVVLDGIAIGETPFTGLLPPGDHVVALRGEGNLGTQPASATLKLNQTTTLSLALEPLEAELTVDPTPSDATVALDGVVLGHGQWRGAVRAGAHRIEVAQTGFFPAQRAPSIERGQSARVALSLERDPTSPLWGARSRPKLTFDVDGGPLVGLSLGGRVGGCDAPCTRTLPLGALARVRVGYELASGLGFTLDAGYAGASENARDRPAVLTELPDGLRQSSGTVSDELGLRALMFGASAAYHSTTTKGSFVWTARLGGGVLVGSMSDNRTGTFSYNGGPPYDVGPYREVSSMTSAYVAPEVRIGWRLGNHFEINAGLLALLLLSPSAPTWEDKSEVVTPTVGGMGLGRFGQESMSGKVVLIGSPTIGVRYDFAL